MPFTAEPDRAPKAPTPSTLTEQLEARLFRAEGLAAGVCTLARQLEHRILGISQESGGQDKPVAGTGLLANTNDRIQHINDGLTETHDCLMRVSKDVGIKEEGGSGDPPG